MHWYIRSIDNIHVWDVASSGDEFTYTGIGRWLLDTQAVLHTFKRLVLVIYFTF